ncbi:MAG: TPR end-of-group domain-containing protein, partial [Planktothrix sp.]
AFGNRGNALSNLGKYEEALASYDQALHYKPDDYRALYSKASIYGLQGELSLAVKNLQQAIKLNPEYKEKANSDSDFDIIRVQPEFKKLFSS